MRFTLGRTTHFGFGRTTLSLLLASGLFVQSGIAHAEKNLLNVSYDVTREFYSDYNPLFVEHWKKLHNEKVGVNQSHGGSSKQARAVIDGLEADVVTMNQASDIDVLHTSGNLIPADWAKRLPNNSAPYTSLTVLLVRKGNPKQIKDWDDLVKPGVQVVVPNPKTSGNGRYTYLAAWGYAKSRGDDKSAQEFVGKLFKNVPVLDTGGRAATTTFAQRNIGDVLATFENEVGLIKKEFGQDSFEVVYPSQSVEAELPVSIVDKVVDKKGTRDLATEYLKYQYSPEIQQLAAKHALRPRDTNATAAAKVTFPSIKLLHIEKDFGGWSSINRTHFTDGALFDQIYGKSQ